MTIAAPAPLDRLLSVTIDADSIGRGTPEQESERRIAIDDLVREGRFGLPGRAGGPYRLDLALRDGKLILAVSDEPGFPVVTHGLSLTPFRSLVRAYLGLLDSHQEAIRSGRHDRIEAVDMGRRGLHNEGATLLGDRLSDKIAADFATLRRLFTLLAALHWKR